MKGSTELRGSRAGMWLFVAVLAAVPVSAQTFVILDDATGGDCTSIGTWDSVTKTCTLTGDVSGQVRIDANGVTLDGDAVMLYRVQNPGGTAILLSRTVRETTGVTIQNIRALNSLIGLHVLNADGNTLINANCNLNDRGLLLQNSDGNTLDANRCVSNTTGGVELVNASNNTLRDGLANENAVYGIFVQASSNDNTITGYTCNRLGATGGTGIIIQNAARTQVMGTTSNAGSVAVFLNTGATDTLVRGGLLTGRNAAAVDLSGATGATVVRNTLQDSSRGVRVRNSSTGNSIYNNNFLRNPTQATVTDPASSTGNVFHLAAPTGGNFWDTFDESTEGCDDANMDGFCDAPFVFPGGQDDLPWTVQDGWGVDVDPPVVVITSPADEAVVGASSVSVSADVTDDSATDVVSSPPGISASLPPGGGTVSGTVPLVEGSNVIAVTATDVGGLTGGDSITVISDTTPPAVSVPSPEEGAVLASSPVNVTVDVSDATATTVTFGANTFQLPAGGGMVTGSVDLVEGTNAITVTATDAGGNTTSVVRNVVLDLTAPIVTIDDPLDGACFGPGETSIPVTATVDDLTETTVTSSPAGVSASLPAGGGIATGTVSLVEGSNAITVTATDAAGRAGSSAITVVLDTTPPAVSIDSPAAGEAVRGTIDFDATVTDPAPGSGVAQVDFLVDGGVVASFLAPPFQSQVDTTLLLDGVHTLTVDAIDGKGNAATASIDVLVDNTPPVVTIDNPLDGATVSGTVPVDATATDGGSGIVSIRLVAGGDPITTGSEGTFDPPVASATQSGTEDTTLRLDGPLLITATARDDAGNETSRSIVVTVENFALEKALLSPTEGEVVSGTITITAEASGPNFASIELLVDGSSLGISTTSPFSVLFDTNTRLDGAMTVTAVARDTLGNSRSCSANVTVDNVKVDDIEPSELNLEKTGGKVNVVLEGTSLGLLLPVDEKQVELRIPGGNAVPAFDSLGSGEEELTVRFDRSEVVASIQAGIAGGAIPPGSDEVVLTLVAGGGFEIGSGMVELEGCEEEDD